MGRLGMVVRLRIEGRHACIANRRGGAIFAGRFYGSHIKPGTKDLGIQYSENFTEFEY